MSIICKLVQVTLFFALFPWTIAFAADSTAAEDTELLLQRIRNRIAAHLSHLHNYTCHAVIDRLVRSVNTSNFDHQDRIDLEVAFIGDRELFSKTGETHFEEQPIQRIVPPGMIGNDAFGSHDDNVFSGSAATFTYAGFCKKDGHKTFRYNFHVQQESRRLLLKQRDSGDASAGYRGSFWVDAQTLDIIRLEWKTDPLPPTVGLRWVRKSMRYKQVRIGNSDFSLPLQSELTSLDQRGDYHLNMTNLERCLEFTGESVVTYDTPTDGSSARSRSVEQQER